MKLSSSVERSIKTLYIMSLSNGFAVGFIAPIMNLYIMQFVSSDPTAIALVTMVSGVVGASRSLPGWEAER